MKNPFLQDRNIFSKVQKPTTTRTSKDQKDTNKNQIPQQRPNYTTKLDQKQTIPNSLNTVYGSNSTNPNYRANSNAKNYGTYQREGSTMPSYQNNNNVNRLSSEKITFGDPSSSQAYHGQKTSGYFNIGVNEQGRSKPQTSYQFDKYEPKTSTYVQNANHNNYSRQKFSGDMNLKQTVRMDKGYDRDNKPRGEYEFAPPPINNFSNEPGQQRKSQQYKPSSYEYKPSEYEYKATYTNNQQKPSYTNYQLNPQLETYTRELKINQNPYPSYNNPSYNNPSYNNNPSYKSPPKNADLPFTPKNSVSNLTKDNHYELSPIGEVSMHKINEDSIMNLDGLIDAAELDKLLAESKTQEELLKILGMDTSLIKRNTSPSNKRNTHQENNSYQHQYQPKTQINPQMHIDTNQNQFIKKNYQPQPQSQTNNSNYQHFKEDQQPQVLNYGESYKRPTKEQNKTKANSRQNQIQPSEKSYNNQNQQYPTTQQYQATQQYSAPTKKLFSQVQQQQPIMAKNKQLYQKQNQQPNEEEEDLEAIMQKEMEKFMNQQQGFGKDKRVFMTANEKIVTRKYKLSSL